VGHVAYMGDIRNAYNILVGKSPAKCLVRGEAPTEGLDCDDVLVG
jgi:hypothetical protein